MALAPYNNFMHKDKCSCGNTKKLWCFSCDACCQARLPYGVRRLIDDAADMVETEICGVNPQKATWLQEEWIKILNDSLLSAKVSLKRLDKQTGLSRGRADEVLDD